MAPATRTPVVQSLTISPDLAQVGSARHFVADVAAEAGFTDEQVFDISVACSEAIANAVEHAPVRGHVEVATLLYPNRLEVHVEGPGEFQTPDRLKDRSSRGMGLPLMAKLSDHLALYTGPRGGTLVALTFYLPGAGKDEGVTPPWISELVEESELVRNITQSMTDEVWFADMEGRVTLVNPSVTKEFGELKGDAPRIESVAAQFEVYRGDMTARPPEDAPPLRALHGEVIRNEEEIVRTPRTGELRTRLVNAAPVRDGDGGIIGSVSVVRDVTTEKQAEQRLALEKRRAELLAQTAADLLASSDPQALVTELCSRVMDELDCHVFFNFLVMEKEQDRLHLNAYAGIPEKEAKGIEYLDFGVAVCGCAARDAEAIVAEDILHTFDPRTDLVKSYGVQAYAAHPLWSEGQVIGTLSFGTRSRPRFSEDELAVMRGVTDLVAMAMTRIRSERVLEESERRQQELNEKLVAMHEEQKSLLDRLQRPFLSMPESVPSVDFAGEYRSATTGALIGGDFYDLFLAPDGRLAIVVGDVSGHGLGAARFASMVKDSFSLLVLQGERPRSVLAQTNHFLVNRRLPGFVTAFLGLLDLTSGELTYASAGHPSPFLAPAAGSGVRFLPFKGSSPLAAVPDAVYTEAQVGLDKADILLLYTDGLTDVRADGRIYGEQGVATSLQRHANRPVAALPGLLMKEALEFSRGRLVDDVALLALRFRGADD